LNLELTNVIIDQMVSFLCVCVCLCILKKEACLKINKKPDNDNKNSHSKYREQYKIKQIDHWSIAIHGKLRLKKAEKN